MAGEAQDYRCGEAARQVTQVRRRDPVSLSLITSMAPIFTFLPGLIFTEGGRKGKEGREKAGKEKIY